MVAQRRKRRFHWRAQVLAWASESMKSATATWTPFYISSMNNSSLYNLTHQVA